MSAAALSTAVQSREARQGPSSAQTLCTGPTPSFLPFEWMRNRRRGTHPATGGLRILQRTGLKLGGLFSLKLAEGVSWIPRGTGFPWVSHTELRISGRNWGRAGWQ